MDPRVLLHKKYNFSMMMLRVTDKLKALSYSEETKYMIIKIFFDASG